MLKRWLKAILERSSQGYQFLIVRGQCCANRNRVVTGISPVKRSKVPPSPKQI